MPWLHWWLLSLRIALAGFRATRTSGSTSSSSACSQNPPEQNPSAGQQSETPESRKSWRAGLQQWTPCVVAMMSASLLFGCASRPSVVAPCPPLKAPPKEIMQPPSTLEFPALYEMLEAYSSGQPPR